MWTTNLVPKDIEVPLVSLEQWAPDYNHKGKKMKETSSRYLSMSSVKKPQILGIHCYKDSCELISCTFI